MARQIIVSQGLLIVKASRSHSDTPHSVGRVTSPSQRPLPDNTHKTHKRQASLLPAGFEPLISASERPQTHASDCPTTGIGKLTNLYYQIPCRHHLERCRSARNLANILAVQVYYVACLSDITPCGNKVSNRHSPKRKDFK